MAPAKRRILETADALFTSESIRGVGIDRLISESRVTKATFYKHYGSKDRLILDYVAYRSRSEVERTATRSTPSEVVRGVVRDAIEDISSADFRGDAMLNAAAEFPGARHPVRQHVREHREWRADIVAAALRQLGHPLPGDAVDELLLARDGAVAGAHAGDPVAAKAALERVLERVLAAVA
ncbi:MAG: TetR/AcrR family transcriptional regulator [Micrococcales bacterium]|nr:TetR/AcrR family transcriptional regulator [Micrococcales bacterium]